MTYHHLNRFKAHNEAHLTPAERLLAWHFSYETRSNRSYYSESLRRLSETLDLNRRTLQKALSGLVDKGLFERIDKTGTYAPTYRLLVPCPVSCEDLFEHNTKQEIEALLALGGVNTPPLNDIYTAPYIEKREEEDSFASENWKMKVLGLIKATLSELKTKSADHYALQGFTESRPREITKAAEEIINDKGLDSWKRQEPYLQKIVLKTPNNLLKYAEEILLIETGLDSLQSRQASLQERRTALLDYLSQIDPNAEANKHNELAEQLKTLEAQIRANSEPVAPEPAKASLAAAHTGERVQNFIDKTLKKVAERDLENCSEVAVSGLLQEILNRGVLDQLHAHNYRAPYARPYLNILAQRHPEKLTSGIVETLFWAEQQLISVYEAVKVRPNFWFYPDQEDPLQVRLSFDPFEHLPDLDTLLTAAQLDQLTARREAINEHKTKWRIAHNIEGEHTPAEFFQDATTRQVMADHPEPLTQEEKQNLLTSTLDQVALPVVNAVLKETYEGEETYEDYLQANFTWEDDLKEFLTIYPARPEGNQNYKQTAKAFLQLKAFITHAELITRASRYKTNLGQTYALSPAKWLENLLTELSGLGVMN
jgi:hypothetical protein